MKSITKKLVAFVGLLVTAVALAGCVKTNSVSKLAEIKPEQVATEKTIENIYNDGSQVYIMFKDSCKACQMYLETIVDEFDDNEHYKVYYIDVENGLPQWFKDQINDDLKGMKTPYLVKLDSDYKFEDEKFGVTVHGRLNSEEKIEAAKELLEDGFRYKTMKEITVKDND